jgi:hypothetical protein
VYLGGGERFDFEIELTRHLGGAARELARRQARARLVGERPRPVGGLGDDAAAFDGCRQGVVRRRRDDRQALDGGRRFFIRLLIKVVLVSAVERAFGDGACERAGLVRRGQDEVQLPDVPRARGTQGRAGRAPQHEGREVGPRA